MSYLGAQFDFEVCVVGFHIELVNCFSVLFPVLFVIYALLVMFANIFYSITIFRNYS